jgi:hypothetical protein
MYISAELILFTGYRCITENTVTLWFILVVF